MKRITIITILAILIGVAGYLHFHQPAKPVPAPVHHRPAPAQVTHGIQKPYKDCVPNEASTPEDQAQLADTEKQMAKYNDTPNNTQNPDLQRLTDLYHQQVAEFDTCTTVY